MLGVGHGAHPNLGDIAGHRVEIRERVPHGRHVQFLVQVLDQVRAALVHVDRTGVRLVVGLGCTHGPQHGTGLRVHDLHGPAVTRTDGDHVGRALGAAPEPSAGAAPEVS